MDILSLRTFINVKELESFSKAAELMFLTQPAVSKRIAALEQSLGSRLFDRIGKRVILTEAGRELYGRSKRLLLELDDCKRAVTNLAETVSGKVSFATSHHIGLHRLPALLTDFNTLYKDVDIDIHFMNSEQAYNAVMSGEVEIALATLPGKEISGLSTIPVWSDPLIPVVGAGHILASTATELKTAKELLSHPAILPEAGNHTRDLIISAFSKWPQPLEVKVATNYLETIKMLISVGFGWGVLPESMLENSDLLRLNIPEISMKRVLGAIHHRERTLSNGAQALLNMLPRL